jgi:hypothetical protein
VPGGLSNASLRDREEKVRVRCWDPDLGSQLHSRSGLDFSSRPCRSGFSHIRPDEGRRFVKKPPEPPEPVAVRVQRRPRLDAIREFAIVEVNNLAQHESHWPRFAPRAAELFATHAALEMGHGRREENLNSALHTRRVASMVPSFPRSGKLAT